MNKVLLPIDEEEHKKFGKTQGFFVAKESTSKKLLLFI
jgi:hypothetical protein